MPLAYTVHDQDFARGRINTRQLCRAGDMSPPLSFVLIGVIAEEQHYLGPLGEHQCPPSSVCHTAIDFLSSNADFHHQLLCPVTLASDVNHSVVLLSAAVYARSAQDVQFVERQSALLRMVMMMDRITREDDIEVPRDCPPSMYLTALIVRRTRGSGARQSQDQLSLVVYGSASLCSDRQPFSNDGQC